MCSRVAICWQLVMEDAQTQRMKTAIERRQDYSEILYHNLCSTMHRRTCWVVGDIRTQRPGSLNLNDTFPGRNGLLWCAMHADSLKFYLPIVVRRWQQKSIRA